jgi:hypothetical protein
MPWLLTPSNHWIGGWVGPRANLDAVKKRKITSPRWELNPWIPIVQPVASCYTDWATPALASLCREINISKCFAPGTRTTNYAVWNESFCSIQLQNNPVYFPAWTSSLTNCCHQKRFCYTQNTKIQQLNQETSSDRKVSFADDPFHYCEHNSSFMQRSSPCTAGLASR